MTSIDLYGRGSGFPFQPVDGRMSYVSGRAKVHQAIVMILETKPRERVMRPDFGCGLHRFIMRANDSATRAQIKREVEQALARWEPRIEQVEVAVTAGGIPEQVDIGISYRLRRDRSTDSLVYPFYLETP